MIIDDAWKRYSPDENTSDIVCFFLRHFAAIGYAIGAVVSIAVWMAVASTGFSLSRIHNHEWWGIFPVLLAMTAMVAAHEILHFVFSNWNQSRFILVPKYFAFAVQIRGEFSKWRYVLCILAPTIIISALAVPAFQLDSPYLMSAVILNLAGSGIDWMIAILAIMVLRGDRLFIDGTDAYVPADKS